MAISEKLSIILSCFNEAENIDYIFDRLVGECKNLGIPDLEIIFADKHFIKRLSIQAAFIRSYQTLTSQLSQTSQDLPK